MILSDEMISAYGENLITPFVRAARQDNVISYGLTSAGYDIRVAGEFKVCVNTLGGVIDPKSIDPRVFVDITAKTYIDLPPYSFALCRSVEWITMPRDLAGRVTGKSTYARCGLILNCTPLEPEWCGYITLELSNTTPLPSRVYVGEGIGQLQFERIDGNVNVSYADKQGKYQNQHGVVTAKIKRTFSPSQDTTNAENG